MDRLWRCAVCGLTLFSDFVIILLFYVQRCAGFVLILAIVSAIFFELFNCRMGYMERLVEVVRPRILPYLKAHQEWCTEAHHGCFLQFHNTARANLSAGTFVVRGERKAAPEGAMADLVRGFMSLLARKHPYSEAFSAGKFQT